MCIFTLILCACPPIWIIELHLIQQLNNATDSANQEEGVDASGQGDIPSPLFRQVLVQLRIRIIEQLLLLCAIVGRWMLPRYGISSDQLSELLLINIGSAADILELFESFDEEAVRSNSVLKITILCLWQASLLQFCFNKTSRIEVSTPSVPERPQAPGSFKSDQHNSFQTSALTESNQNCCLRGSKKEQLYQSNSLRETESQAEYSESTYGSSCCHGYCLAQGCCCRILFGTELWAILLSLMLQDVPFLCLRLTLIFGFGVQSYQNVFFTIKNILLILAQVFRSSVLLSGGSVVSSS
ncbi:unnamed protein product [Schistocephalus solidus]|uniref:Transmembrane protein 26 n=1 Tax=Schistocephalus solidus TaxID=70667 RepID=A0A183TJK1_SCHSO|nr:unnamed protein product [Schistocephalus solidus]